MMLNQHERFSHYLSINHRLSQNNTDDDKNDVSSAFVSLADAALRDGNSC